LTDLDGLELLRSSYESRKATAKTAQDQADIARAEYEKALEPLIKGHIVEYTEGFHQKRKVRFVVERVYVHAISGRHITVTGERGSRLHVVGEWRGKLTAQTITDLGPFQP
jgi:hypothetical protein